MKNVLWSVGSVLLATLAGGLVIAGIEAAARALLAADPGSAVPPAMFGAVVIAWGIGAAVGVHVVARLGPRQALGHGLAVLCLFVALGALNLVAMPHPLWVIPAAIVAFTAGGAFGFRTAPAAGAAPAR